MKEKQERQWRKSPVAWEQGEREALIEAALARGHVTQVPSVDPQTLEKQRQKPPRRTTAAPAEDSGTETSTSTPPEA